MQSGFENCKSRKEIQSEIEIKRKIDRPINSTWFSAIHSFKDLGENEMDL